MPITQILLTAAAQGGGGGGGGGGESAADFTVEWFQKVENSGNNPRPWSIGLYPTQLIAVSYEGMSSDYYWINNSAIGNVAQNHVGQGWRHMAYVRRSGVVYGYLNGTQYFTVANNDLITNTSVPLYVGTGEIAAGTYKGYITNLHIMKGTAKYTGNFTPPVSPIVSTIGSVFLMNANTDLTRFADSVGGKVTVGVTGFPVWSSDSPFTALGPYTQYTNVWGNDGTVDFNGANYNANLLNVKAGWAVTDGETTGTVTSDAVEIVPGTIRIGISFSRNDVGTWTFTQPGLGSVYFDGGAYVNYGASPDWAMDVV
jgi:hypothetical protein